MRLIMDLTFFDTNDYTEVKLDTESNTHQN